MMKFRLVVDGAPLEWRSSLADALEDAERASRNARMYIEREDGERIPLYRVKHITITKHVKGNGQPPDFEIAFDPEQFPDGVHEGEAWHALYQHDEARGYINVGYDPVLRRIDRWTFYMATYSLGS